MVLIEREALLTALNSGDTLRNARNLMRLYVEEAPTIDAAPVVHGRLINKWRGEYNDFGDCSICGAENLGGSKVCCQCGARMDGGEGHEDR